ncbi:Coenzyme F420 hydrogenase [Desulfurobacterium thermolithotrophum DSM 11699]|uniref:Coenzyme F420 hydrogenase n=1 Tax=Desulfurobacterium thermolithotrophum (strain DSM 11699 / BSA) TaxID=868864 RepID=F0S2N2_DESTD|nr:4Fe-4S binding protein [Desulfurobacterium thermolithotrophum]ADY73104.1 Coenzyme F420 hydrogenase [Desulfurobacterium thermolithotrophum DSM 11699]
MFFFGDNFDFDSSDIKIKIGFFHFSSCSGCQVAFLDMFEDLVEILDTVELAYSSWLTKKREIPKLHIAFVEGALCIEDKRHLNLAKELAEKANIIVTVGGCASFGGVRRLSIGNQAPQPSHQSFIPLTEVELLRPKIKYAIPGCPPNPSLLYNFMIALLEVNDDFLQPFEFMANSKDASGYDIVKEIINKGLCTGCGTCVTACSSQAMGFNFQYNKPTFNPELCVHCGSCLAACPQSFKPYPQPVYS